VTDSGSIWSSSANIYVGYGGGADSLTIASSGEVFNACGYIGEQNMQTITASSSPVPVRSEQQRDLYIGDNGAGDVLTISDGGVVFSMSGYLGCQNNANSNSVLVDRFRLRLEPRHQSLCRLWHPGHSLTIGNSGLVASAGTSYIGYTNRAKATPSSSPIPVGLV